MRHPHEALVILLGLTLVTGCATPYGQGRAALAQGRYEEALTRFETLLAREPDRLDALVGVGLARFKLGAFDEAIDALGRAVAQAPGSGTARLYLGLSHLRRGADGPAEEHLAAFLELKPNERIARQVDRALRLMRSEALSPDLRAFVAASLDDAAEWEREVQRERAAAQAYATPAYYHPYGWYPFGRCYAARHGRLVCF